MMKIDLTIALLTLRAAEPEQLGGPYLLCVRKEIKFARHTVSVSGVTYNQYFILLMFRYPASSIFRTCNKLLFRGGRLGSRPVSAELTFLEDTRNKKILNGWRKRQPAKGLIAVKGQVRSGHISCS